MKDVNGQEETTSSHAWISRDKKGRFIPITMGGAAVRGEKAGGVNRRRVQRVQENKDSS